MSLSGSSTITKCLTPLDTESPIFYLGHATELFQQRKNRREHGVLERMSRY